ncbi:MAG: DUF2795 domain-containing protein [bacterium]
MITENELSEALKGLNFPATKNEIMGIAKNNHASGDMLKAIKNLPKDRYMDMQEMKSDIKE